MKFSTLISCYRLTGLSLFLVLFFSGCSKNDGDRPPLVITTNVSLPTQKSVDSFAKANSKYAGVAINGNVVIGDFSPSVNINNLRPLSVIQSISGDLGIIGTKTLSSLAGLENIKSVHNLYIQSNQSLTNLKGLDALKTITGFFFLETNTVLASVDGLQNLEEIKGSFKLTNGFSAGTTPHNPALASLHLPELKKIGGDFDLNNTKAMTSFNFPKLDTVMGYLAISNAGKLANFTGFETLKHIGGGLTIAECAVTSFTGFNSLQSIGQSFQVNTNPNITNLAGFSKLDKIGSFLQVNNNINLVSLNGLGLLRAATDIRIEYNSKLTDFCAIKPLIQQMLITYPTASPYQLIVFLSNSNTLPYPHFHSHVINDCP